MGDLHLQISPVSFCKFNSIEKLSFRILKQCDKGYKGLKKCEESLIKLASFTLNIYLHI